MVPLTITEQWSAVAEFKSIMTIKKIGFLVLLGILFTASCQSETPVVPTATQVDTEPIFGQAPVDSLEVLILESFPVQAQVVVRGSLPDGCTTVDTVSVTREGDLFTGVISTVRPGAAVCTELLVPFERVVALDVLGLAAGNYRVSINGVEAAFDLAVDNVEPTPTPQDGATASIQGALWHDLCGFAGGTEAQPEVVSDGCVQSSPYGYIGNGVLDAGERGIEGIVISIGKGPCPQQAEINAVSDLEGGFTFSGLSSGTYCVFVDPLGASNRPKLIPGRWTAPEVDQAFAEVTVGIGETVSGVNFGWDYDLLPPVNFEGCTNEAVFIEDVTIPDDTVIVPGGVFTKTWRMRNIGTCHWSADYTLTYAAGDRLAGEDAPLTVVLAGEEVNVSVVLSAPLTDGEYRGDWQLKNPAGEFFGKVGDLDLTFFVKIVVDSDTLTDATIIGVVWSDECLVAEGVDPSSGCVSDDEDGFRANGTLDEGELPLPGLLLELYPGLCPPEGPPEGDIVASAQTEENGQFRITGLEVGQYCLAIDPQKPDNLTILQAGNWTFPGFDVPSISVEFDDFGIFTGYNFGWDYAGD
jgi:inhibitor of cysteine peptidase